MNEVTKLRLCLIAGIVIIASTGHNGWGWLVFILLLTF